MADTLADVLARARLKDGGWLAPSFGSSRSPLRRIVTSYLSGTRHRSHVRDVVDALLSGRLCPRAWSLAEQPHVEDNGAMWGGLTAAYFIRIEVPGAVDRRPIKIGRSNNPAGRLWGMQTSVPYPLTLLATWPEVLTQEGAFHAAFAHLRLRGEWFRPGIRLRRVVAEIATVTAPLASAYRLPTSSEDGPNG